jgi:hypothetical protein
MIRHLITAGCSFTSDGIGGAPPSVVSPMGGCSFIQHPDLDAVEPMTWAGMLAQRLNVSSLVNMAAVGHGNIAIANNILALLQRFAYSPNDTLIAFNISDPGRLDIPCEFESPDKSIVCTWGADVLPFSYMSIKHDIVNRCRKFMGIDHVETFTTNSLLGMMSFITRQGYQFRFMTMKNYYQHPAVNTLLQEFQSQYIDLEHGHGMAEFVEHLGLNSQDGFHPDPAGHVLLTDTILRTLNV